MRKCGVQGDPRLLNVAAGAGRARRSFRCPAAGRFATSGGKCPQGTRFPSRLPGFGAAPQALCRSTRAVSVASACRRKKRGDAGGERTGGRGGADA